MSTRGRRPGRVPPHVEDRLEEKRARAEARAARGPWYRRPWFVATVAAIVALVVGIVLGRVLAPDPLATAAEDAQEAASNADTGTLIWEFGTPDGMPSVQSGVDALREGDASVVTATLDRWAAQLQQTVQTMETIDTGPAGRGVVSLFTAANRIQLEAVEVVGAAAAAEGPARDLLLDEAERLHALADRMIAQARAALAALRGEEPPAEDTPPDAPDLPRPGPTPS